MLNKKEKYVKAINRAAKTHVFTDSDKRRNPNSIIKPQIYYDLYRRDNKIHVMFINKMDSNYIKPSDTC